MRTEKKSFEIFTGIFVLLLSSGFFFLIISSILNVKKNDNFSMFDKKSWVSVLDAFAASFDSGIYPSADNSFDIGGSSLRWKDGYFAGNMKIDGTLSATNSGTSILSVGDIGFLNSGTGIILKSPSSTCFRVTITTGGSLATSSVTCP